MKRVLAPWRQQKNLIKSSAKNLKKFLKFFFLMFKSFIFFYVKTCCQLSLIFFTIEFLSFRVVSLITPKTKNDAI